MKPLSIALLVAALLPSTATWARAQERGEGVRWDRAHAEHLLNRAGFGATPDEVDAAVRAGLAGTIERLFHPPSGGVDPERPEPMSSRDGVRTPEREALKEAGGKEGAPPELIDEARRAENMARREDRSQLEDYKRWWLDTMAAGTDPLRDRMTLFWHGYFTSSMGDVKSSYQMIQQNRFLREHATGSFRDLLFGIAKDPAMLEYLDNDTNKKGAPNENFAREVMELFTLGEGNYSEDDIKEAARAFTGWRMRGGEFVASPRQHDRGRKTVLGVTGRLDGEDVLEILLARPECAPHVIERLLTYLEGVEPSAERRDAYAALLRETDYELEPVLRALFADPAFYRPEVLGTRVAGPVDFLVGMTRRLELTPPADFLAVGSKLLGQDLFFPPNVKGWEGGLSWITTAKLMERGNLAGLLLGVIDGKDLADRPRIDGMDGPEEPESMVAEMDDAPRKPNPNPLGRLGKMQRRWRPTLDLAGRLERAGARTDRAIVEALCDRLLAIQAPPETIERLTERCAALRAELPQRRGRFADRRRTERAVRRLAHLILSLPEAQLN